MSTPEVATPDTQVDPDAGVPEVNTTPETPTDTPASTDSETPAVAEPKEPTPTFDVDAWDGKVESLPPELKSFGELVLGQVEALTRDNKYQKDLVKALSEGGELPESETLREEAATLKESLAQEKLAREKVASDFAAHKETERLATLAAQEKIVAAFVDENADLFAEGSAVAEKFTRYVTDHDIPYEDAAHLARLSDEEFSAVSELNKKYPHTPVEFLVEHIRTTTPKAATDARPAAEVIAGGGTSVTGHIDTVVPVVRKKVDIQTAVRNAADKAVKKYAKG